MLKGQELFVSTEPASNMASKSVGFRLNNTIMPPYSNSITGVKHSQYMYRLNPEIMFGINRYFMFHANLYFSNMHQANYKFEGGGFYLKYRFLSIDNNHSHFRMATYVKASLINNPIQYHDINLSGDNSGISMAIVATQLLHKLAISFTGGYTAAINNFNYTFQSGQPQKTYNYALSSGYLIFPIKYKNYKQTNVNFYTELLGKYNPETHEQFLDIVPAIQFIMKSRMRLDIGYRKQISGNMLRINNQELILRFEYNIFNAYK